MLAFQDVVEVVMSEDSLAVLLINVAEAAFDFISVPVEPLLAENQVAPKVVHMLD